MTAAAEMQRRIERFNALVEPRLDRLYRVAYRLTGNRPDAEDLVQEACLQAWEKLPTEADSPHVGHWLTRVLYHRFIDGARRRHRSPLESRCDTVAFAETVPSQLPGPCELAELAERERMLERAWAELEPMQKVLLSLRAEGFSLAEIEEVTRIDRQVLRARLHRARQSFVRHLRRADSASPPPKQAEANR